MADPIKIDSVVIDTTRKSLEGHPRYAPVLADSVGDNADRFYSYVREFKAYKNAGKEVSDLLVLEDMMKANVIIFKQLTAEEG